MLDKKKHSYVGEGGIKPGVAYVFDKKIREEIVSNEKTMKIEIEVTERRVGDLLIDALEGGSTYWVLKFERVQGTVTEPADYRTDYWAWPFLEERFLLLTARDTREVFMLDRAAIERGLRLFPLKCPEHFGHWLLAGEDDATTGDAFLQLCLFGEIVYA